MPERSRVEDWLDNSLNGLDDTIHLIAEEGYELGYLIKLRGQLIRTLYWCDRMLMEIIARNKARDSGPSESKAQAGREERTRGRKRKR